MEKLLIDPGQTSGPVKRVWSMGFNTCHAALMLRDDLFEHVKRSREIGFEYIRFHNVFSERVGIYKEDDGKPMYDFTNFDVIFDRIVGAGLLPFFELSMTPEALKTADTTICHYKANTSLPKNYEKWYDLVRTTVTHAVERYGLNCVKRWYFEVWNEPDLPFLNGEMEDYFNLYDYAALAVKSVSQELRVGGPATSRCKWIDEFIHHIEDGSEVTHHQPVPCDFISTHAYPSDLPFLNSAIGEVQLQHSTIMRQLFQSVREKIDASSLRKLPLFMGEWNSSAGPYAFNHDERNNAAFIVKTLVELKDIIDGSLYWNLSDIYEEGGFHYTPFHGGYGIFNVNSIPKSSYNAFAMLHQMKGQEIILQHSASLSGTGILATYDDETRRVNILLYYYVEPDSGELPVWNVTLQIPNQDLTVAAYKSLEINEESGSPYEWWKKVGSPDYLTVETMQLLMQKSNMALTLQAVFSDGDLLECSECIQPGNVKLIQLTI